jgi:hypothetical protein
MQRLWADFNQVYDNDQIRASLRRVSLLGPISPGEWVELYDSDGETCWAMVDEIRGSMVQCTLKRETWTTPVAVDVHVTFPPTRGAIQYDPRLLVE